MPQPNDLSRSLTPFVQGNTLVAVIELSLFELVARRSGSGRRTPAAQKA